MERTEQIALGIAVFIMVCAIKSLMKEKVSKRFEDLVFFGALGFLILSPVGIAVMDGIPESNPWTALFPRWFLSQIILYLAFAFGIHERPPSEMFCDAVFVTSQEIGAIRQRIPVSPKIEEALSTFKNAKDVSDLSTALTLAMQAEQETPIRN